MRAKYLRRRSKQGALLPEVATDYQGEVAKLMETARLQREGGKKRVEHPRPRIDPRPAPESRTRGFFRMAIPWFFPGGVGWFFDDRPFWDGPTFGKWLEHITYD